ncbi:polyketide synthase of type I, partial [Plesiocystis pacifica SIR-1]
RAPRPVAPAPAQPERARDLLGPLLAWLRERLGSELAHDPEHIDPRAPFEDYGLDSVMIYALNGAIEDRLGVVVSKTLFFEHACLEAVCGALLEAHGAAIERAFPPPVEVAAEASPRVSVSEATREPIAIIGLSGRYPEAPDLDALWANLVAGRDCVGEVPSNRWDIDAFFDPDRRSEGSTYTRWGAFLDGVEEFEHRLFKIAPREARQMDPQERLLLQTAWAALEDAGYCRASFLDTEPHTRTAMAPNRVGVYTGVTWGGHQLYAAEAWAHGQRLTLDSSFWSIANRVSWMFNFRGPSMPIDTACSASLVGIAMACEALVRGEIDMALAGGVNLYLHPSKYLTIAAQGFASSDGKCRAFGRGGDGYVPGEGVGVVILKPLSKAERDGDAIHGLIRGWAVNHDGFTNGYSVPNPRAQSEVVSMAMERGGVDPQTITYVEAHGTGTALGDPIEVAGLTAAFGRADAPWCGLGAIKSNIGHLESAAGIVGLTKVLLQMRHRTLVPTLHVEALNPNLDMHRSPFRIQRELTPWEPPAGIPRRAGLSSFGAGGVNAHLVLEEYREPAKRRAEVSAPSEPERHCLVLSARTAPQLRKVAEALRARLAEAIVAPDAHPRLDLANLAFTLQLGREPLNVRLAWLASDLREAMAGLDAYLGGPLDDDDSTHGPGPWMGRSAKATGTDARSRDQAQAWLRARELSTCARAWVRGRALDWHELHPEGARRRVHLPTYPFVGERLWMPDRFTWTKPATGRGGAEDELPEMAMVTPRWQPWTSILEASTGASAAAESGATVVLTGGSSQTCDELLALLDAPSASAPRIVVETGGAAVYRAQGIARLGPHHLRAPLDDAGDADALLAALSEVGAPPIVRVIDLCDVQPGPRAPTTVPHGRLRLLQRWIAGTRRRALRLIHVHRDVDPRDARDFDGPSALLAGLLPVLDAEYGRLAALDLEFGDASTLRHAPADAVRRLLASGRGRARLRNGMLERLELEPHPVLPIPDSALRMNPNGVYLLSGGTGGVALTLAGALVDRGARRLALLERGHSRSAEVIEARAKAIAELEARGAQVLRHQGSLLDSGGLDDLLARLSQVGPVLGVIHAAGWNDPSEPAFIHKTRAQMEKVFEAKISGLHGLASALSRHGHRPDWVVLCSSISAAVPGLGVGMSDYAAANAWMDRYATSRDGVGSGTRWLSLRWPNWSEVGMGETPREPLRRLGLAPLRNVDGVALFECALVGDFGPVVTPVAIDEEAREGFTLKSWLEGSLGEPAGSKADPRPGAKPQPRASEAAAPTATPELGPVHAWLQAQLSETLELPEEELEVDLSFEEFGLDSILMVRLLGQLDRELGVALDPSALIELGTIERLSEHLLEAHPEALARVCGAPVQAEAAAPLLSSEPVLPVQPAQPVVPPVQARVTVPRTASLAADEPIAIIGMAGHFPGASSVEQFWANLRDGVDAIAEVPESRWSAARYFSPKHAPGKTISRWGGFLPNIEDFDPAYFELDEAQARGFDPLIRQTLEVGAEAFAHAGYSRAQLRGSRTGVWLGARVSDFIRRVDPSKHGIVGVGQNFIAAHLAHFYDLRGPNLIVDSACSSSLVTVHQACQALRAGEVELALAGGVDLLLDEQPYLSLSESRALSPTGRCRTFDRRADGFVPGEGCGMVLLARLSDALERGDRVLAIVEGSAVNNDGRTMGVTTPNPEAQVEVVREALRRAGAEARSVSLIEAHGTGTVIGDPIELKALTRVFRESTQARGVCGIGSVKSNVGHLASAAGIAGLIKVAACLQARYQAPTLHCLEPNPRFDFAASPFVVLTQGRPWQPVEGVRRGGVSAFGLGGTNAHVVLAEAPEHRPTRAALPAPTFHRRRLWPDAPARPEAAPRPARRRLMQLEFSR